MIQLGLAFVIGQGVGFRGEIASGEKINGSVEGCSLVIHELHCL